uniref:Uncharacterized protein n=1 Tax=Cacopsylla melanoneura TaxID=428564 RepID=A0A8D8YEM9_9HEMI
MRDLLSSSLQVGAVLITLVCSLFPSTGLFVLFLIFSSSLMISSLFLIFSLSFTVVFRTTVSAACSMFSILTLIFISLSSLLSWGCSLSSLLTSFTLMLVFSSPSPLFFVSSFSLLIAGLYICLFVFITLVSPVSFEHIDGSSILPVFSVSVSSTLSLGLFEVLSESSLRSPYARVHSLFRFSSSLRFFSSRRLCFSSEVESSEEHESIETLLFLGVSSSLKPSYVRSVCLFWIPSSTFICPVL